MTHPKIPKRDEDKLFQQDHDTSSLQSWRDEEGRLCVSIDYHDSEPRSFCLSPGEEKMFMLTARLED